MARAGPSGERENYDQFVTCIFEIIWHNLMGVPGQACAQFPPHPAMYTPSEKFQILNQWKSIYVPTYCGKIIICPLLYLRIHFAIHLLSLLNLPIYLKPYLLTYLLSYYCPSARPLDGVCPGQVILPPEVSGQEFWWGSFGQPKVCNRAEQWGHNGLYPWCVQTNKWPLALPYMWRLSLGFAEWSCGFCRMFMWILQNDYMDFAEWSWKFAERSCGFCRMVMWILQNGYMDFAEWSCGFCRMVKWILQNGLEIIIGFGACPS